MRYIGEFADYNDRVHKVEINTPTQIEGVESIPITLGGTPFVYEMSGTTDDIFKPVKYGSATLNIVSDKYLFDLYSNKNNIDIKVTCGDKVEWIGLIEPLIFEMGYDHELEEIEIECIDYLTILENFKWDDDNYIIHRPMMSFLELFRYIMGRLTRYKNIYYPNIFDGVNMLEDYKISTTNFIDEKCKYDGETVTGKSKNWKLKDIVEEMCKYMGLTLVAYGEDLHLLPILSLQEVVPWIRYSLTSNESQIVGATATRMPVDNLYNGSDLSLLPIYNKFTVKAQSNKIENILPEFLKDSYLKNITTSQSTETTTSTLFKPNNSENDRYEQVNATREEKINNESIWGNFKFYQPISFTNIRNWKWGYIGNTTHNTPITDALDMTGYGVINWESNYTQIRKYITAGIIDFRKVLKDPENQLPFGKNTEFDDWQRYIYLSKGINNNIKNNAELPLLKLQSDTLHLNNRMAVRISAEQLAVPYRLTLETTSPSTHENGMKIYTDFPIERDKPGFVNSDSDPNWDMGVDDEERTKKYSYIQAEIKITLDSGAEYYFCNFRSDNFLRTGYWTNSPCKARIYFDSVEDKWVYGYWRKICDNSLDEDIQQDKSGYWIKFSANQKIRYIGDDAPDKPVLPDNFTGKIEVTFYPNDDELHQSGKAQFYRGSRIHFLKDFEMQLITIKDLTVSDDEFKSDTSITNVIDVESFQDATEIVCKMNSDFGKQPSYSTISNAKTYSIYTIQRETIPHIAEEWICFNYAVQYRNVRKVLETEIREDITPLSVIIMNDRPHFGRMLVNSYEKDLKTGYNKVTLVELCDVDTEIN